MSWNYSQTNPAHIQSTRAIKFSTNTGKKRCLIYWRCFFSRFIEFTAASSLVARPLFSTINLLYCTLCYFHGIVALSFLPPVCSFYGQIDFARFFFSLKFLNTKLQNQYQICMCCSVLVLQYYVYILILARQHTVSVKITL